MDDQTAARPPDGIPSAQFEMLPNGKQHVSFSEMRDWQRCSWRHRLKHVLKVDLDKPGPAMDFGSAVHASCENYLRTRVMDPSIAINMIREVWERNRDLPGFEPETVESYVKEALSILDDVPAWLESTFPGWQFIDAEHLLYEPIEGKPHAFKGYIDGIIRCDGPRGKPLTWLIDWKTTGWGWKAEKKADPNVRAQLVLYKNYWSKKVGEDPSNVRCGFILLKRSAKPGTHCELIVASVGDVTIERSLKVINNMVSGMKRGVAIKNRAACLYCEFKETEHCT